VPEDQPVLNTLAEITAVSVARGTLDAREHMLARLAALVAIDAPAASYVLNVEPSAEVGLTVEDVQGLLIAIAPIVGTPRVVSAAGKITDALGFVIDLAIAEAELEAELEAEEELVAEARLDAEPGPGRKATARSTCRRVAGWRRTRDGKRKGGAVRADGPPAWPSLYASLVRQPRPPRAASCTPLSHPQERSSRLRICVTPSAGVGLCIDESSGCRLDAMIRREWLVIRCCNRQQYLRGDPHAVPGGRAESRRGTRSMAARGRSLNVGTVTAAGVVAALCFTRPEQEDSKSNSSCTTNPSRALSQS
jgi:alkylhydroperoxidase/carboxymuconolactone decarboxylase family protein YurZ